ncbi:hypothetical protein [Parathalassolituus penaei]|uniref:DUF3828 domain-containing protein n=1 Tax=Parathalassolituus penaei TaxID=2997323 RepID=A0A9X3IQU6_9GAMM|nr:hypothetical protein [Parathalassolituus penaei]MCY0964161.1 hypothetical protein [Parathalassolituus penaei]
MLRSIISAALIIVSFPTFAWDTPKEAVEKFVQFDLGGGRLSSNAWSEYLANYLHAPVGYEEPGWDSVVVVERFLVGNPECVSESCTVAVTYQLHPTKLLTGPPVVPHEAGGSETVKFSVSKKNGVWKIDPNPDYPRISIEKYKQLGS